MNQCLPWGKRCLCFLFYAMVSVADAGDPPRHPLSEKQHSTSDSPFLKPDQAVGKMTIPQGFEVSVFAAEPDIGEPIAFTFDDRGRIWVVENFNYRTRGKHTNDPVTRIQILEDTDGDGVFDKKKMFTDKLTFTSGIALGFGGVFVGSPPHLSFIPDADGDDTPDGPPEVLLDGWGINDRHETLNSFIWGPDGWLYGCQGVFTKSRVGHPGDDDTQRQFIDGGIWRYHPTQKKYEVFARGLSNPWGFDFDDHGQGLATCCVIPHLFHMVQGGVYHKQSLPHVNPFIYDDIKTIRDHTHLSAHGGARVYLADAFPAKYRNRLFMCNIHEHAVLTDVLVPKGSSFVGKHGDDFLPTNDKAWVGFSIEIGPEGGVYLLDWHDTDVCGNAINFPNSGRIYRIMPQEVDPVPRPDLRSMTDEQLVDLQWHTNDWYVRQARVLLHSRRASQQLDTGGVHRKLRTMLDSADTSPRRLRALWALHVTGGMDSSALADLLDHEDANVRGWAIQLLCEPSDVNAFQDRPSVDSSPINGEQLAQLVSLAKSDPSPTVRLYLASAAGRLPWTDRWPILSELAKHGEDVDDNNLPKMIWFALEPMVPSHPNRSLKLVIAGKLPRLQEFVARRLSSGDLSHDDLLSPGETQRKKRADQNRMIQKRAFGFQVRSVGEGGVVAHSVFRNRPAVQTHPKDRQTPCCLNRNVDIPVGKRTYLNLKVSHHPHGDWQLRVLAGKDLLLNVLVGPDSVTDEWLDVRVDLTKYAGERVTLTIENRANNWLCEWAYWNEVRVVSE